MNASDRPAVAKKLDQVFATWLKPSPSPRVESAAFEALDAFDCDDILNAMSALIAAGGKYLPSISDIRDETARQAHASARRYAAPSSSVVSDGVCACCEGIGQVEQRRDTYTTQPPNRVARTLDRTYWTPCTQCARGRRIAANRAAGSRPSIAPGRETRRSME
jgi:hypothetical protein